MPNLLKMFLVTSIPLMTISLSWAAADIFYGCPWNADSLANLEVGKVAGREIDYRFRAQRSGSIDGIRVYLIFNEGYYGGDGGEVLLELQTDDGTVDNLPSGTVLASSLVTDPMAGDWNRVFTLSSSVQITEGVIYHMVFTNPDSDPVTNYVSLDMLYSERNLSPVQPSISDTDLAVIWKNSGSAWAIDLTKTPIFCFNYEVGEKSGVGYIDALSQSGEMTISGADKVRETFTVTGGNRTVSKVSVRVKKSGSPGDLNVRLEYSDSTLIDEGTIPSSSVSTDYSWVTYTFGSRYVLESGQSYNLTLSESNGGAYYTYPLQDGVQYGFDTPWVFTDGNFQYNSGASWQNFNNRTDYDMQFYFDYEGFEFKGNVIIRNAVIR